MKINKIEILICSVFSPNGDIGQSFIGEIEIPETLGETKIGKKV